MIIAEKKERFTSNIFYLWAKIIYNFAEIFTKQYNIGM